MKVWTAKRFTEGTVMGTDPSTGGVGFVFLDGPDRILHSTRLRNEAGEDTLSLDFWRNGPAGFEKQTNIWVEKNSNFAEVISSNRSGNTVAEFILSGKNWSLKTYSVGPHGLLKTLQQPAPESFDRSFELSPKGERYWWAGGFYETASGKLLKKTATPKVERNLQDQKFPQNVHWTDDSHVVDLALVNEAGVNIASEKAFLLWSVEEEKAVVSVPAVDALCHSVASDGQTFVEGGADQRIRIRDAKTLVVKQTLRVHEGAVNDVACHPTLPLVATASSDWTVKIWDLRTNALVEKYSIFSDLPVRLRWSPDGTVLSLLTRTKHYFVKPKVCQNGDQ
jgi:WD40 repeat protein